MIISADRCALHFFPVRQGTCFWWLSPHPCVLSGGGIPLKFALFVVGMSLLLLFSGMDSRAADLPPTSTTEQKVKAAPPAEEAKIDSGDTAWMLVSTGLVLL